MAGGGRTWRGVAGEALAADLEAEAGVDDGDRGQDILVRGKTPEQINVKIAGALLAGMADLP